MSARTASCNSRALRNCACGELPAGSVYYAIGDQREKESTNKPLRVRAEYRCPGCGLTSTAERMLPGNCKSPRMAERQSMMVAAHAMARWNLLDVHRATDASG